MGNSNSRSNPPKLKPSELQEFSKQSLFSVQAVEKLYHHFYRIASSQNDDGIIDIDEFCSKIHKSASKSRILIGLFNLFDVNTDGAINFREFLQGLSIFNKFDQLGNNIEQSPMIAAAKAKEQVGFSLRMLDLDKKKKISAKDVESLLVSVTGEIGLKLSRESIGKIVTRSFLEEDWEEEDDDMVISHEGYTRIALKRPECFDWLAPDIERIMQEYKQDKKSSKKSRCLSI